MDIFFLISVISPELVLLNIVKLCSYLVLFVYFWTKITTHAQYQFYAKCFLNATDFFSDCFFSFLYISIHIATIENPLTVTYSFTISLSNQWLSSSSSVHWLIRTHWNYTFSLSVIFSFTSSICSWLGDFVSIWVESTRRVCFSISVNSKKAVSFNGNKLPLLTLENHSLAKNQSSHWQQPSLSNIQKIVRTSFRTVHSVSIKHGEHIHKHIVEHLIRLWWDWLLE